MVCEYWVNNDDVFNDWEKDKMVKWIVDWNKGSDICYCFKFVIEGVFVWKVGLSVVI